MNDAFYRGLMWTRVLTNMMMRHADKVHGSDAVRLGYRLAVLEMQVAIDDQIEDIQESTNERTS